jgi:hypothetical protein
MFKKVAFKVVTTIFHITILDVNEKIKYEEKSKDKRINTIATRCQSPGEGLEQRGSEKNVWEERRVHPTFLNMYVWN